MPPLQKQQTLHFPILRTSIPKPFLGPKPLARSSHKGVSENKGTYFGVLIIRILLFGVLSTILGSPIFGSSYIPMPATKQTSDSCSELLRVNFTGDLNFPMPNIGALIIRTGFGGILYYSCNKEPFRIGNYFGPYIKPCSPKEALPFRASERYFRTLTPRTLPSSTPH